VSVTDLPAALLAGGDYTLNVPGQGRLPLPTTGQLPILVSETTTIRLVGDTYVGSLLLDPKRCQGGDIQTLQATPKPAKLVFQAGEIPLTSSPQLAFPRGETEMRVTLEFKAANYRSKIDDFRLTPGNNPIRITLEQLEE
jgi:hypothetical protein